MRLDDGTDDSCSDVNYYYTQGRCCPYSTYWNGTDCVQFAAPLTNCKKMTYSTCQKCADTYNLSFGQCISSPNYFLNGVSTAISITNCTKVNALNPAFCETCSTSNTLTLNNRCCTSNNSPYYFNAITNSCVLSAAGTPSFMDLNTGQATTCFTSGDLVSGLSYCCPAG